MPSSVFRRRWLVAILAIAVVATGGLAYAAIPDASGIIHTCYTKSSGAWRVIDTGLGQNCKSNEAALDLYSKGGADALFLDQSEANGLYLGKTEKAADSDKLDGQDSSAFLGASAKAADSDRLDGRDSFHYLKGFDARLLTDFVSLGDGVTHEVGHQAEGLYPGMSLALTCDTDGGTNLVASSQAPFVWWWDETFGQTSNTPPFEHTFPIGDGVESHTFRGMHTIAWYTTVLELDSAIGSGACTLGWTVLKAQNDSPGP